MADNDLNQLRNEQNVCLGEEAKAASINDVNGRDQLELLYKVPTKRTSHYEMLSLLIVM